MLPRHKQDSAVNLGEFFKMLRFKHKGPGFCQGYMAGGNRVCIKYATGPTLKTKKERFHIGKTG